MASAETLETQRANRRFVRDAMRLPLLTAEREAELARRWRGRGDEPALHELVSAYMRLVVAIATRFKNYGLPLGDLIQEGNIGLMQAAARFEPEREVRFATYASWWIRSAIQDYVLRNWSIVRTGTTAAHKSLFFNLRRLRARIDRDAGARLTAESRGEIARLLNVSTGDVEFMESRLSVQDRSLNARLADIEDSEWQDFIPDDRPSPEEAVMERFDAQARIRWLRSALQDLSPRERTIIHERRLREDALTLEMLGRRLGISKERVRQIEHRALMKLRRALTESADGDPAGAGLIPA